MLPPKIRLTEQIIAYLKNTRTKKRIPASTLAKAINRDSSYISSLELGRLLTISAADFVAILCFLLDINESSAIEKAEDIINAGKRGEGGSDPAPPEQHSYAGDSAILSVSQNTIQYQWYGSRADDNVDIELLDNIFDDMKKLVTDIYLRSPKETIYSLNCFNMALKFDPMLAMSVLGAPYYTLKGLSIEKRKRVMADISNVIKQHAAK